MCSTASADVPANDRLREISPRDEISRELERRKVALPSSNYGISSRDTGDRIHLHTLTIALIQLPERPNGNERQQRANCSVRVDDITFYNAIIPLPSGAAALWMSYSVCLSVCLSHACTELENEKMSKGKYAIGKAVYIAYKLEVKQSMFEVTRFQEKCHS